MLISQISECTTPKPGDHLRDTGKAFGKKKKKQLPGKTLNKLGLEGCSSKLIKSIYKGSTDDTTLDGKK